MACIPRGGCDEWVSLHGLIPAAIDLAKRYAPDLLDAIVAKLEAHEGEGIAA